HRPRCETGLPATPPPPAGIRTRGGCSYSGFGLLRYLLRRSTALGAKRVCRQLRRRLAFAPGAGAPTAGSGFSDMLCVGAPPSVRNGLAPTPPPAGIRTRGGCSYGGFGLLRYVPCRSTALGAKRVCRQPRRRRLTFAPGAGAPTVGSGFSDIFCVGAPPRCETGLPTTPPPPAGIRTRGGCSYSGLGLLRYVSCRSTAPVRNGAAGSSAPPTLRTSWCSSLPGT